ncbi:MAG: Ger(x)C family spore germination C-terminal domain-containing protein [Clostridia bacterium]|nr:Ger(x)C family spore germination C-terminal domain-containing protein [Clostridia bacterium]
MKRPRLKYALSVIYLLVFAALAFLFFTNDFGLLDLRKTSVVIGVALDIEEDEVVLTAQLAVPQPAENGENTKFNVVTGKGVTVAAALNEVNVKTGFYPKMVFCKLIVLGESCFQRDLTELLDYFYRNEYTGLTLRVAACEGKASELIAQQFPCGNSATDVIDKLLSSEAQASGNVAATTVKELGEKLFSKSACAYMPFLENGILEESGGGEGGGEGGGSGGSGGGAGGQCEESELTCNKCAVFADGYCKGVLDEKQTFALNLLFSDVKHAFLESGSGDEERVLGLRDCKGGVDLKIEDGSPVVEFSFKSTAKVQDEENGFSTEYAKAERVKPEVLRAGEETVSGLFESLFESARTLECDIFGLRTMLYKNYYGKYEQYADGLYNDVTVKTSVKLKSSL